MLSPHSVLPLLTLQERQSDRFSDSNGVTAFVVRGYLPYEQYTRVPVSSVSNRQRAAGRSREKVARHAFGKAVEMANAKQKNIELLVDHNRKLKLADTLSDSLKLFNTDEGLFYTARVPKSRAAEILQLAHARGKVTGSSFGYLRDGKTSVTRNVDVKPETIVPLEAEQLSDALDGSDYVHGIDPKTKNPWTVLKRVDLNEISVLRAFTSGNPSYKNAAAKLTQRAVGLTRRDVWKEWINVAV